MSARLLADLIVVIHAAFVLFIVAGQAAILYGLSRKRHWARSPVFRVLHLLAIGLVILLTLLDRPCPLTVLENRLRKRSGGHGYPGDFIGYWVHELLFLEAPRWVFAATYLLFGLLVVLTFLLAPPDWSGRQVQLANGNERRR